MRWYIVREAIHSRTGRESELRAHQQVADVSHADERRHVRRHATVTLLLGHGERLSKFDQRVLGEHGRDQGAVGQQALLDALQTRRQVVDPMQREIAEHEADLAREQRRQLLVALDPEMCD